MRYGSDILLLFFFCSLLAACGGGGGADSSFGSPSADTLTVAGYVEDGAVSGARVSLIDPASGEVVRRCWASGQGRCEAITDDLGHFRIDLAQDADPSSWILVAAGGRDSDTGISFTEVSLDLSAPAGAYSSLSHVVISPLTTLLARRVSSGQPLDRALSAVAAWAGLAEVNDLLVRPTDVPGILQRNLVLMAAAMHLYWRGETAPWDTLAANVGSAPSLFDSSGRVNAGELTAGLGFSADEALALAGLAGDLAAAAGSDQAFGLFNRYLLGRMLGRELDDLVQTVDPAFDIADARYLANREALFDQLVLQGGRVPLWDLIPQRLLQHVLYGYGLNDPGAFLQADPAQFVAGLVRADAGGAYTPADDPRIGAILTGQPRFAVRLPLSADRMLPAGDNMARVAYYYNSDLSHLYRADALAQAVLDDQLNDELMIELIRGVARSGLVRGWVADSLLPYDPWRMIDSRIFNPVNRALARIELAEGAARWGFSADALDALAQAEQELRGVLAAKGTAFFNADDAANFRLLAQGYLRAGDFASALAVLRYLHLDIAVPVGTYLAYANAFSAGMGIADELLAAGDSVGALTVIDELRQIAVDTPTETIAGSESYKNRVFHMVEAARRYALAGSGQDALDLYYGAGMIADLRSNDGLPANRTGSRTRIYMDDMAVALYLAGDKAGALALLDTLSGLSRSWGYKQLAAEVAVAESVTGGLLPAHDTEPPPTGMTALDLVFYRVPTDLFNPTPLETQVEALTYYVANRQKPYLGLRLIEESLDADAVTALQLATDLVRQIDVNLAKKVGTKTLGSAKIDFGLAKIADLYVDLGMNTEARQLLVEAEQALSAMTDPTLVAMSLASLGDVYLRLGDAVAARDLLARAGQGLSLDAYDTLIDAMLRAGAAGIDQQLDAYWQLAWDLYPSAAADSDLFSIARHLLQGARYARATGRQALALDLLDRTLQVVQSVSDPRDRLDKLIDWAAAHAEIDTYDGALDAVRRVEEEGFRVGRNRALLAIGRVYAGRSDLDRPDLAVSDMDADGAPDFFHPLMSPGEIDASGLTLDDDMDGDGLSDDQDPRPMFFDSGF
ncbi:hypothetical protein [Geothermobacter ehrlichii]|uniref:hypothetical protein n=1 Tax=Geothermobacter ehrlichii TaxID=213224 RepID=UPI0011E7CE99|nr:hypothetical protein [Geothermobacter ehrlichii]